MSAMPAPIAVAWAECQAEARPFQKLHRLIDTYETVLKYTGVLAVQNFYAAGLAAAFPDTDRLIRDRIARPMLGDWAGFIREVLRCFAEREGDLVSRELFLFHFRRFGSSPKLQKHFGDQGASGRLLALRNQLAHGATLPDEESASLIEQHKPDLLTLLQAAAFLADLPLFYIVEQTGEALALMGTEYHNLSPVLLEATGLPAGHVVVHNPETGAFLDLHPLLVYTECEEELARWDERHERIVGKAVCRQRKPLFYNDLKAEDRIAFLDYWRGHNSRFKSPNPLAKQFRDRFPKPERRAGRANWFELFIREWTAHFVGRDSELAAIDRFVAGSPRRALVVVAPPGMGKSALLAKWADENNAARHFIREGDVVTYDAARVFENLGLQLAERFEVQWKTPQQMEAFAYRQAFEEVLKAAAEQAGGQVVVVVDGLDEAVRALAKGRGIEIAQTIVDYLPDTALLPEGVRLIVSTRPELLEHSAFAAKFGEDKAEHLKPGRLTDADVRALLFQVRSKYEVLESEAYVDAIVERSEGSPLYLRMLLEELSEGHLTFGQIEMLPRGVVAYFERILEFIEGEGRTREMPDAETLLRAKRETLEALVSQGILTEELVAIQMERERAGLEGRAGVKSIELLALYCLAKEPLVLEEAASMLEADRQDAQRAFEVIRTILIDDTQGRFAVFHSGFREYFLRLGDYTETRLHRHAETISRIEDHFLAYCARWREHQSRYALRKYIAHLFDKAAPAAESVHHDDAQTATTRAVHTLTDIEFIEARCQAGLLQYQSQESKTRARQITNITQREMLHTVAAAIDIETTTLERFPDLTFQTLINSCRWIRADWVDSVVERWTSSWEASGHAEWLERLLPPREIPHQSPIARVLTDSFGCEALAFSADGKYLAGAGGQRVVVWEVESGKTLYELTAPQLVNGGFIDISWSEDNRRIAAIGHLEGFLALWELEGARLRFFQKVHDHGHTVAFCPQALRNPFWDWELLTCGGDSYKLWFINGEEDEVLSEALSSKKLWAVQESILGKDRILNPPLVGADWGKLGGEQVIIVAAKEGDILILKAAVTPVARSSPGLITHHINSSEDGRFIAAVIDAEESPFTSVTTLGNDHAFVLLDNEAPDQVHGYRLKGHIAKVSLLASENRILTCEEDHGLASLWSLVPFGNIGSWQGPTIGLNAGALGKGNHIAVSTKLHSVMLLNPKAMSASLEQDFSGHVWSMSVSPNGDSILAIRAAHELSSRFEGDIALVRLKNQEINCLEAFRERDAALSAVYLPDGRFVTGHMDGIVRLWSSDGLLESKQLIQGNTGIGSLCVNRGGDLLAASCGTWYDRHEVPSTVHILQLPELSEVHSSNAGEKGYGVNPGNVLSFGGRDNDLLCCGGSPIRIWRKTDSGWKAGIEIENEFGVISGIGWSHHLSGFVLSFVSMSMGGVILLYPIETGWRRIIWKTKVGILGLGISECGKYVAFTDLEKLCRFCRFDEDGSITVLAKHFIPAAAEVWSAVVSWDHKLVAFGDSNGDIHAFRIHE
jgi:WD40 repeat protein